MESVSLLLSSNRSALKSISRSSEPWLVFAHGNHEKRKNQQTFYSISEDKYHAKSIPAMHNTQICTASYGWMVLRKEPHCFLFNPITMVKIQLPPSCFYYHYCVLTSSPDDPKCAVLFLTHLKEDTIMFRFCNPLDRVDKWIEREMIFKNLCGLKGIVSMNGKAYASMNFDKGISDIIIIEAVKNDIIVQKLGIETPFMFPKRPVMVKRRIVASCGEVYMVSTLYQGYEETLEIVGFEFFKVDFDKKCWERVESIGNRAFFLGFHTCYSSTLASDEFECGIIYYTDFKDPSLYTYNVKEKSMSISLPCPNVQSNWNVPYWFLPSSEV